MSPEAVWQAKAPDGLILAGGRGRRLGGADKGLLPFRGVPAASHALRALQPRCGRVFLCANRNLETYRGLGGDGVIEDLRSGYPGPLAGLEAARALVTSDRVLLLPCDTPAINPAIVDRLLGVLDGDPDLDAVYAGTDQTAHFLVSALRRRALCSVSACLDRGDHSVRAWLRGLSARRAHFTDEDASSLQNRNQPEDWAGG